MAKFSIGEHVRIRPGATDWMKTRRVWNSSQSESIDCLDGVIEHDYTAFDGDQKNYQVAINDGKDWACVHPYWLEKDMSRSNGEPDIGTMLTELAAFADKRGLRIYLWHMATEQTSIRIGDFLGSPAIDETGDKMSLDDVIRRAWRKMREIES